MPRPLVLRGGRHGVLLFHGLSSSPLELQFVGRGLQRAGHTVHVPVISGYTHGLIDHRTGVDDWIAQALQQLDALSRDCDTVAVGGLCIGAVLALQVAAARPSQVDAVLALSTALHFDGWGNAWYTPLLPLARYLTLARRITVAEKWPYGLKDERMRGWIARQMQASSSSDAGASVLQVGELLKARTLIKQTRQALHRITATTLLLHAVEDECATPRSAHEVAARVSTGDVRLVLLRDSYHMLSMDREKEQVLAEMVGFLRTRCAAATDPLPHLAVG